MAHSAHAQEGHHASGHDHGAMYYVKIWAILMVLLVISLVGPMLEVRWVTIVTAFGIAVVKALMVAAFFMHLKIEKRFVWYMLYSCLLLVSLFFFGVAADIMKPDGSNWTNKAAHDLIKQHQNVNPGHGSAAGHAAPAAAHGAANK